MLGLRRAVIIRPDLAVYGAAESAEDVAGLVQRYHQALTGNSQPPPATPVQEALSAP